jgi:hypothetical protein
MRGSCISSTSIPDCTDMSEYRFTQVVPGCFVSSPSSFISFHLFHHECSAFAFHPSTHPCIHHFFSHSPPHQFRCPIKCKRRCISLMLLRHGRCRQTASHVFRISAAVVIAVTRYRRHITPSPSPPHPSEESSSWRRRGRGVRQPEEIPCRCPCRASPRGP